MLDWINLYNQLASHLEHQNILTKCHTMHLVFLLLAGLVPWGQNVHLKLPLLTPSGFLFHCFFLCLVTHNIPVMIQESGTKFNMEKGTYECTYWVRSIVGKAFWLNLNVRGCYFMSTGKEMMPRTAQLHSELWNFARGKNTHSWNSVRLLGGQPRTLTKSLQLHL